MSDTSTVADPTLNPVYWGSTYNNLFNLDVDTLTANTIICPSLIAVVEADATAAGAAAGAASGATAGAAAGAAAAAPYATAAAASATAAATSATNAASSASTATTEAVLAGAASAAATTSATNAANSATAAATSATNAAASATTATNAATSATNSATSATASATTATNAATSATNSASSAIGSASAAAGSAAGAVGSAGTATLEAGFAAGSAAASAASATAASGSAGAASGSATSAGNSATSAGNSATSATTSANNASTSATNAANSATAAASGVLNPTYTHNAVLTSGSAGDHLTGSANLVFDGTNLIAANEIVTGKLGMGWTTGTGCRLYDYQNNTIWLTQGSSSNMGVVTTIANLLDDGVGQMAAFGPVVGGAGSSAVTGTPTTGTSLTYDVTDGCELFDEKNNSKWLYQTGMTSGNINTKSNILDDGVTGNMTLGTGHAGGGAPGGLTNNGTYNGPISYLFTSTSVSYTILTTDSCIIVTTSGITLTLPSTNLVGWTIKVANTSSGTITIANGSRAIYVSGSNFSGSYTMDAFNEMEFVCTATTPTYAGSGTTITSSGAGSFSTLTSTGATTLATSTGAVTTRNNTLDDGSGNMLVGAQLTCSNIIMKWDGTNGIQLFDNHNGHGWLRQIGAVSGNVSTNNNILDDGSGNVTVNGVINVANAQIKYDGTNGIQVRDQLHSGGWLHQPGAVSGAVATNNNTIDDGSGNMVVLGSISANSSTTNFHIAPKSSGSVGFTNQAQTNWGLQVTDGTSPGAFTFHNTLDDGSGNMSVNGNLTVTGSLSAPMPYGTNTGFPTVMAPGANRLTDPTTTFYTFPTTTAGTVIDVMVATTGVALRYIVPGGGPGLNYQGTTYHTLAVNQTWFFHAVYDGFQWWMN